MSSARHLQPIPVNDYLEGEAQARRRHEYVCGTIYAQAGGTNSHNLVATNVTIALGAQLRGKPCRAFNSDTKIRIRNDSDTRFYYPDASVICEPNPPTDSFQDQPRAIVEVMSPSTKRIDQGEKRSAYLSIATLDYYVVFEQDHPSAAMWQRENGDFTQTFASGLDNSLALPSIECVLRLSDVYDGVVFPETSDES
jgi:Uma2 family endonuclease